MTPRGTYVDLVLDVLAAHPDREAVKLGDQRVSYADARSFILRTAAALRGLGLRRGDVIALAVGNRPDTVLLQLAIHLTGAQLTFVPPEPGLAEQSSFLKRAEPAAFVYDPRSTRSADLAALGVAPVVLTLGPSDAGTDLLALVAEQDAVEFAERAERDDIVTLFYTGGTTGTPKMVLHRHSYYDSLIFASERRRAECPTPQRFLVCTTVNHASGHISAIMTLLAGGTVILIENFDAGGVIEIMARERVTSVIMMPPMLYAMLDHPDLPPHGYPDLVRLHYSGAPTSPQRIRQAVERFGPVLRQTYGLTEVPVVTLLEPEDHDLGVPGRLGSAGKPLTQFVEVVLRRDGLEVPVGEVGEVCVRGPLVMAEYRRDPAQTEQVLRDGWLHTGDLGRFDADGYLHLVDRVKDVIITGDTSANVYCALLEAALAGWPGVRAAVAVGLPDEQYGEAVHVVCVLDPDAVVDPDDLRKHVLAELGTLYEPKTVTFVESLPWTAVGKIDKKAVRAMLAERVQPA